MFNFDPYLVKIPNLTHILQMGWFNHQPVMVVSILFSPVIRVTFITTSRIIPVSKWLITMVSKSLN